MISIISNCDGGDGLLDLDVHSLENSRAGRHRLHRPQETKADLSTLVSKIKSIANEKSTFNFRYHHLTVLISVFANFSESYSRWSTVINFLVHSIMYTYYTLKALRLFLILCKPFPAFFVVPWKLFLCQGTFTRTTSACYHHFSSNFCPSFQQKTFRINNIY